MLKRQKNKCASCGLKFRPNELRSVDHIKARSEGGDNTYKNKPIVAPTLPRY
ncbi:MAG: HNH endonuclease [Trichodesmium sp. MAG_R03]|nr:HNH endonuclease [Trichodesmium sp. MAG_R03]